MANKTRILLLMGHNILIWIQECGKVYVGGGGDGEDFDGG